MQVRGILFDKDGTLLDYHATWMPANRAVVHELASGDAALAHCMLVAGGWNPHTDRVCSGTPLAAGDLDEIAEVWLPFVPADSSHTVPSISAFLDKAFPASMVPTAVCDLAALFDALESLNLALGVATADSEYGLRESLKPFDLLQRVAFAAGFDSGYGRKPSPGMVYGFCEAVGLSPSDVVVVGDNRHDIEMAHAAGAMAIGVLTGTSSRRELQAAGAETVLDSIADLPARL